MGTKGQSGADVGCIYLGAERKRKLAARVESLGLDSFSLYVCAIIDAALKVPVEVQKRELEIPVRMGRYGPRGRAKGRTGRKRRQPSEFPEFA